MSKPFQMSPQRAQAIAEEIATNSYPAWRFFALLIASSMIASFGLAANSTAVIIGAMLVSPLMTPIFGIALGILRGDVKLIGGALRAELWGAILAVGSACLVGLTPLFYGEATSEMLTRTAPNLIDLLVAVFAGFAGAYALIDERISPALPGVAIATAIVPPLSTCGLCLSLGAWSAAGGSLLLFLTNVVSILVVALLVFSIGGLARPFDRESWWSWIRRFGPSVAAFAIIAVVMTKSLVHIIVEHRIERSIRDELAAEFATDLAVELVDFAHHAGNGRVQVLANVRAPRNVMPGRVTRIQESLASAIGTPVDLVIRTTLARDTAALGARLHVRQPDLSGAILTDLTDADGEKELAAAQVIREHFESDAGFELTNLEYGVSTRGNGVVLAYVDALSRPPREEIQNIEQRLRERLGDEQLTLALRLNEARIETSFGPFRVEWSDLRGCTPAEYAALVDQERIVRETVAEVVDMAVLNVHFRFGQEDLDLLIEVAGPTPVTQADAAAVEEKLRDDFRRPIHVSFWYRNEFIVSAERYTTYDSIANSQLAHREEALQGIFRPQQRGVAER